jgi:hypothetical protein
MNDKPKYRNRHAPESQEGLKPSNLRASPAPCQRGARISRRVETDAYCELAKQWRKGSPQNLKKGESCSCGRKLAGLSPTPSRRGGLSLSQSRLRVGFSQSTPAPLLPVSLALSSTPYGPLAMSRPAWRRRLVSSFRPPIRGFSNGGCLYSA